MKKIKLKTSIILLLVSVLGIVSLVSIAQSQNTDNFDNNRNLARIFRLVNSLNKEAEKQQAKGFEKRAEMLKNYFQKKTGISNEAKLKLDGLATNFQQESEKLNAEIKEFRKNQKNKPNEEALASEFAKLRESRNKLFADSRQSLNNEVAKDDSEKVLKFLRENVLDRIEKNKNKKNKKTPNNNLQSVFQNVSYDEATDEAAMTAFMTAYSWIDYDQQTNEILSVSVTEGDCLVDLSGDHDDRENECSLIYVSASLSDPETGVAADSAGFSGSYADVYLFTSPTISGQYCVDAEHRLETDWDYFYDYSQTSDCVNVELPTIDILWNGNSIRETTQEAVVGQKIELSVAVTGGTPTSQQWTIDGEKVKNYEVNYTDPDSFTTATVTELENQDLSQGNIQFYWVDGEEDRQIQVTANINGTPYTASATFNVKRPTAEMTAATSTVQLGDIPDPDNPNGQPVFALHFGSPFTTPGITFSKSTTLPNGVSGSFVLVQVAITHHTIKPVNANEEVLNAIGLDTYFPYPYEDDSPLNAVEDKCSYTSMSSNGNFTMFLMFKPQVSSGDSIYVPLRKMDWSWSGTATRGQTFNSWVLTSSNPSFPQNLPSEETTEFPEWVANVTQFDFQ